MTIESTLQPIREILDHARSKAEPDEVTLRHALSETWFSDSLAWLLDPQGSHGLGDAFLKEFVMKISGNSTTIDKILGRLLKELKLEKHTKKGRAARLSLENATSLREYYLPTIKPKNKARKNRYADVVVFDLDPGDGLFLVVENKLFGANHRGQLRDQFEAVELKYSSVPIRKYVYLTLMGDRPTSTIKAETGIIEEWTCLSWTTDVLGILDEIATQPKGRLKELVDLLRWLRGLINAATPRYKEVHALEQSFMDIGVNFLTEELIRIGDGNPGSWEIVSTGPRTARLKHSSAPMRTLAVSMLTNCSLAIQSKYRKRARCEKIVIPFGAPADQTIHLLRLTARDVYSAHFDKPAAYLSTELLPDSAGEVHRNADPFLDFIWRHQFEIAALLYATRRMST